MVALTPYTSSVVNLSCAPAVDGEFSVFKMKQFSDKTKAVKLVNKTQRSITAPLFFINRLHEIVVRERDL